LPWVICISSLFVSLPWVICISSLFTNIYHLNKIQKTQKGKKYK
jgi:hypothetical protein